MASLVPLLKNKKIEDRPLYWHYPHYGNQGGEPSSMIMEGDWKLIHYHEDGRNELYDLSSDPGERNDLLTEETKRSRRMGRKLDSWLKETKATFPTKNPDFDPTEKKKQTVGTTFEPTAKNAWRNSTLDLYNPITNLTRIGGAARRPTELGRMLRW